MQGAADSFPPLSPLQRALAFPVPSVSPTSPTLAPIPHSDVIRSLHPPIPSQAPSSDALVPRKFTGVCPNPDSLYPRVFPTDYPSGFQTHEALTLW